MSSEQQHGEPDRPRDERTRLLRRVAFGIAGVPVGVLVLFAVAEGVGREQGWWGHVLQLVPVGAALAVARVRPRVGGVLVAVVGLVPLALALWEGRPDALLGAGVLLTLPLVTSGVMLALTDLGRT